MRYFILLLLPVLLFSCKSSNNKNEIKELTFTVIPSDDMVQTIKYTDNFSKYLARELGIKVRHITATDYTAVIEAMRSNKCHICILGPFSYILAHDKAGAEAIVTMGLKGGGLYSYKSYLLTNKKTGVTTIDGLIEKAPELHLAFSDPASTSGHLIPRGYLTSIGLDPGKNFASMSFTSSHAASMLSVYTGKSDICASSSESYNRLVAGNRIDSSSFVILWKSKPILTDPFCIKNTLPEDLKQKIKKAFLEMPEKDSAAFNQYIKYTYKGDQMRDSLTFASVHDSAFNFLRVIARSVKSLNIQ